MGFCGGESDGGGCVCVWLGEMKGLCAHGGFVLLGQRCGGGGVGSSAADQVGVVVLYLSELFCECASEPSSSS